MNITIYTGGIGKKPSMSRNDAPHGRCTSRAQVEALRGVGPRQPGVEGWLPKNSKNAGKNQKDNLDRKNKIIGNHRFSGFNML